MSIFENIFGRKKEVSWEEKHAWDGEEEQICPRCGNRMTKRYDYSAWWCESCHAGLDDDEFDDDDDEEYISVYEAAEIWCANGKDEDYTFGYTEEELEDALE